MTAKKKYPDRGEPRRSHRWSDEIEIMLCDNAARKGKSKSEWIRDKIVQEHKRVIR